MCLLLRLGERARRSRCPGATEQDVDVIERPAWAQSAFGLGRGLGRAVRVARLTSGLRRERERQGEGAGRVGLAEQRGGLTQPPPCRGQIASMQRGQPAFQRHQTGRLRGAVAEEACIGLVCGDLRLFETAVAEEREGPSPAVLRREQGAVTRILLLGVGLPAIDQGQRVVGASRPHERMHCDPGRAHAELAIRTPGDESQGCFRRFRRPAAASEHPASDQLEFAAQLGIGNQLHRAGESCFGLSAAAKPDDQIPGMGKRHARSLLLGVRSFGQRREERLRFDEALLTDECARHRPLSWKASTRLDRRTRQPLRENRVE